MVRGRFASRGTTYETWPAAACGSYKAQALAQTWLDVKQSLDSLFHLPQNFVRLFVGFTSRFGRARDMKKEDKKAFITYTFVWVKSGAKKANKTMKVFCVFQHEKWE